jgi:hypothetical protein
MRLNYLLWLTGATAVTLFSVLAHPEPDPTVGKKSSPYPPTNSAKLSPSTKPKVVELSSGNYVGDQYKIIVVSPDVHPDERMVKKVEPENRAQMPTISPHLDFTPLSRSSK